jgi:ribosomal protein S18 acetylase RimI-like enzyme
MHFEKITRWDNTNTRIIGELDWRQGPGRVFEVHIDVDPEYHRKGIGSGLIEELERLIEGREPMSLYTFMAVDNDKAYHFFTAVGFKLFRVEGFYGNGRDAYFGCKTIGTPK